MGFLQNTVDKLIKKTNLALVVGSSSWREQFVSAVTVSAGESPEDQRFVFHKPESL